MAGEQEAVAHLARIEELLGVLVRCNLAEVTARELDDPRKESLYELTGTLGAREIAKRLHCSATTVCETWRRWERLGIIMRDGKQYRKVV